MYTKIMVPLDGSTLAECVLPHVESLAGGCQTKDVVFIRVVEPVYIPSTAEAVTITDKDRAEIEKAEAAQAEEYLKKLIDQLKYDGVRLEYKVLRGKIVESMVKYAEDNNIDLVVIATHGRSGISRWVWGSQADKILRSICIPVLMVRAPGCIPGVT